jgi:hypothetical protein
MHKQAGGSMAGETMAEAPYIVKPLLRYSHKASLSTIRAP